MGDVLSRLADSPGGTRLLTAAATGDLEGFRQELQRRPNLIHYKHLVHGSNCMHHAAAAGHLSILQAGKDVLQCFSKDQESAALFLNRGNRNRQTPLMVACSSGRPKCVSFLLEQGADAHQRGGQKQWMAIHYAAAFGRLRVLQLLLNEATEMQTADGPRSVLSILVRDSNGICRYIDSQGTDGMTALHLAAWAGALPCVQALVCAGASILGRTVDRRVPYLIFPPPGSTPLHIAASQDNMPIVHTLLQVYAEYLQGWGFSPMTEDSVTRRARLGDNMEDPRRVVNGHYQLPCHVASLQLSQEVLDPMLPIERALEVAVLSQAGLGPQTLAVLAADAVRKYLLQQLCQVESAAADTAIMGDRASACMQSHRNSCHSQTTRVETDECGVCLSRPNEVSIAGCHHVLCATCASKLLMAARILPICPFCRQTIEAFG